MKLLAELPKAWTNCVDCPMNYDGLDCHLYKEQYKKDFDETFDPYEETPKWCKVESIRFYDENNSKWR